jgi:hypothetical protein
MINFPTAFLFDNILTLAFNEKIKDKSPISGWPLILF